ncbi:MAG TPA: LanC-like protein [Caulobacteraceae bacterium]
MALFDPARHEPLADIAWDPAVARGAIERIVADVRAAASPEGLWPNHPQEELPETAPQTMLYLGAAGVIWGLDYLVKAGAARPGATFAEHLGAIGHANHAEFAAQGVQTRSFLLGDAGVLATRWRTGEDVRAELAQVIGANTDEPMCELMWGAPGTMLVALRLFRQTGEARWAELFRAGALALERIYGLDEALGAHIWTQLFAGRPAKFVGAVHGFAGNAYVLAAGRELIDPETWSKWSGRLAETFAHTAVRGDDGVNWPSSTDAEPRLLMQHCHGAPGMVACLAGLPEADDDLLLGAGELTWTAGPLAKGANLCHGTAGNGYAFLKLFERTGDDKWLARARAFAMHAIAQSEREAAKLGRRRYSLWTGDVGLAVYLWQCLQGGADYPTMDVL